MKPKLAESTEWFVSPVEKGDGSTLFARKPHLEMVDKLHATAVSSTDSPALPMLAHWFSIEFISSGWVNRWMAPAIRGMVLKPLRKSPLCSLYKEERARKKACAKKKSEKNYCKGCLKMAACRYGRAFEPDMLMLRGKVECGKRDGLRPITFAANFPQEAQVVSGGSDRVKQGGIIEVNPGDTSVLRLLAIGRDATTLQPLVVEALDYFGAMRDGKRGGLGPDRVRFRIAHDSMVKDPWSLDGLALPREPSTATVPWLNLVLEAPLLLKRKDPETKIVCPNHSGPSHNRKKKDTYHWITSSLSFAELFSAALETTERAVRELGDGRTLDGVDFEGLKAAAGQVRLVKDQWKGFGQRRSSSRQNKSWPSCGVSGNAVFADVPIGLIPWLQWGGRLGVGDSRVCGAGLWYFVLA